MKAAHFAVAIFCLGMCSAASAETAVFFSQNRNGGWSAGWHSNQSTKREAYQLGMEDCEKNGGTACTLVGDVFSNACVALAVQSGGNGYSMVVRPTKDEASKLALSRCNRMGARCRVVGTVCDDVKERQVICTKPVFKEEFRLKQTLDGTPEKTKSVTEAINYLNSQYCRTTYDDFPDSDESEPVEGVEMCRQYSGLFRGERVYWGLCHE